jgi:hypothetical protein
MHGAALKYCTVVREMEGATESIFLRTEPMNAARGKEFRLSVKPGGTYSNR